MGESQPGDSGLMIPGAWSMRESPWRLWTCDSRFRLWDVLGRLKIFLPRYRVWERCHTKDCGHVSQVQGLGGRFTLHTVDV